MRLGAVAVAVVGALVVAAGVAVAATEVGATHHKTYADPFRNHSVYVHPDAAATAAAASATGHDKTVLDRLVKVPTAVWLTPEAFPIGSVGTYVHGIVAAATKAGRTPLFVVYGIPDRDCVGGDSAGGLDPADYRTWVSEIAKQTAKGTAVVLEPDALASAPQCNLVTQREHLLSYAVKHLATARATVYLDAGHANWISPDAMGTMLLAAGVRDARGFATNVSYFDTTATERAYAGHLRTQVGGGKSHYVAHYVVDTSRNGNGPDGDQWCNPSTAALGAYPHGIADPKRPGLDAELWIKIPGESDGSCNGAPDAGVWWTAGALQLAQNAGW